MLLTIIKPRVTPRQKAAALAVAVGADLVQIVFWPLLAEGFLSPFEDVLDLIVAGVLIAVCGFRWQFVLAFFLEAVPGFDLFPTWTALVLSLPTVAVEGRGSEVLPVGRVSSSKASGYPPVDISAVAVPPVQAAPRQ